MDEHLMGQDVLSSTAAWHYDLWELNRVVYGWRADRRGLTALSVQTEHQFGGTLTVWFPTGHSATIRLGPSHLRAPLDWPLIRLLAHPSSLPALAEPTPIPAVEIHCAELKSLASADAQSQKQFVETIRDLDYGMGLQMGLVVTDGCMLVRNSCGLMALAEPTEASLWAHGGRYGETLQARQAFRPPEMAELAARTLQREALTKVDCPRPTGQVRVILDSAVAQQFLDHYLVPSLTWSQMNSGQVHFSPKAMAEHTQTIAPWFTVELDTLRPYHIGSFRFDAHGIVGCRLPVIEEGRLVSALGVPPGEPGLSVTPSLDNARSLVLYDLRSPTVSDEPAVLVTAIEGLRQSSVDGEFAVRLRTAFRMEGNHLQGRVDGVLRGNWWSILQQPDTTVWQERGLNYLALRCDLR